MRLRGRGLSRGGGRPSGSIVDLSGRPLAVVTAFSPGRERPAETLNRDANARLKEELVSRGAEFYEASGRSPDGAHTEPSFGVVGMSESQARELGEQFREGCVFYWDGERGKLAGADLLGDAAGFSYSRSLDSVAPGSESAAQGCACGQRRSTLRWVQNRIRAIKSDASANDASGNLVATPRCPPSNPRG